jgi:PAS domain S-box-containing protein
MHESPQELAAAYHEVLTRPDVREAEFGILFNRSLTGVAYVARDGTFMKVNRKYAEMLGYTPKELECRKTYQSLTHPADVEAGEAEAHATAAGEQDSYRMQKRYIHKQGYSVWVDLQVCGITTGEGEFVHFLSQTQELRLPDSHLRVTKDADGNPHLIPVVPLGQFLWANRRWLLRLGLPLVASCATFVGAVAQSYYRAVAELEQSRHVIQEQGHTIEQMRQDMRRIEQALFTNRI